MKCALTKENRAYHEFINCVIGGTFIEPGRGLNAEGVEVRRFVCPECGQIEYITKTAGSNNVNRKRRCTKCYNIKSLSYLRREKK